MNRNTESHFAHVPELNHPRSRFDRSFSHKTTFDFGQVIPVYCEEVLPGDTVSITTSKLVRLQTMLAPILDNMYLDTYFFFVPNRLVWKHWEEFMGENKQSAWIPPVEYSVPCVGAPAGGFQSGTIADYLGLPVGVNWDATDIHAPTALAFRGLAMICNEFFRDQNLTDPLVIPDGDSNIIGSNGSNYLEDVAKGGMPFVAAKFHDYFSSCLPAPQKGPSVVVPTTGYLPVIAAYPHEITFKGAPESFYPDKVSPFMWAGVDPTLQSDFSHSVTVGTDGVSYWANDFNYGSHQAVYSSPKAAFPGSGYLAGTPLNLWASAEPTFIDKANTYLPYVRGDSTFSAGLGIDIASLRLASITQMYYEALARGGSRYDEQIRSFFGITSPDSRLQHPEYLGGNRIQINVHEITNQAQSEEDFLGDLGAYSATADVHSDFTHSFTEHGILFGLVVARYDHTYTQGMPQQFTRKSRLDFYNPLFANIGEQPVYQSEIYASSSNLNSTSVFGYQEAWASYRYSPNRASALLRPGADQSLGHWTVADHYASAPTLSDGWIREDKSNVDRVLAVTSSLSNQLFGDFYFNATWVRCMPMYSVPGVRGVF